jgi:hypothetical protein
VSDPNPQVNPWARPDFGENPLEHNDTQPSNPAPQTPDLRPESGWYPDPADANRQRYWDGKHWTAETRGPNPVAPTQPEPVAPIQQPSPPTGVPSYPVAPAVAPGYASALPSYPGTVGYGYPGGAPF